MIEDLLYCRDLFDPIETITNLDDSVTEPKKPEKMDDKEWDKLKRKTLGTIRQWVVISLSFAVSMLNQSFMRSLHVRDVIDALINMKL